MARKISVKFNGKTIGTRTTDRPYTHALVLTDFNPDVVRAVAARYAPGHAKDDAISWAHSTMMATTPVGQTPTETRVRNGRRELAWPWPVSQADHDKAVSYLAGASVEQYHARRQAQRHTQREAHISKCIARGPVVLSYHGSIDLARKAQSRVAEVHPEYTVLIVPVEA